MITKQTKLRDRENYIKFLKQRDRLNNLMWHSMYLEDKSGEIANAAKYEIEYLRGAYSNCVEEMKTWQGAPIEEVDAESYDFSQLQFDDTEMGIQELIGIWNQNLQVLIKYNRGIGFKGVYEDLVRIIKFEEHQMSDIKDAAAIVYYSKMGEKPQSTAEDTADNDDEKVMEYHGKK